MNISQDVIDRVLGTPTRRIYGGYRTYIQIIVMDHTTGLKFQMIEPSFFYGRLGMQIHEQYSKVRMGDFVGWNWFGAPAQIETTAIKDTAQ